MCTPEATLARIQPLLQHIGITRLANVTYLDEIGIPVYQAIRPNAKTLSVSQGKGLTRAHAAIEAGIALAPEDRKAGEIFREDSRRIRPI